MANMKKLNNYILEKLHINKDINIKNTGEHLFGGLEIAPDNICFDDNRKEFYIANHYSAPYYRENVTDNMKRLVSFIDLGRFFTGNDKFNTEDGDITCKKTFEDGWRLPSMDDYDKIFSNRHGSTVNGKKNVRFTYVHIMEKGYLHGLLLFPDDETINGAPIIPDDEHNESKMKVSEVKEYIKQGCAFFSYSGNNISGDYITTEEDNDPDHLTCKRICIRFNKTTNTDYFFKTSFGFARFVR